MQIYEEILGGRIFSFAGYRIYKIPGDCSYHWLPCYKDENWGVDSHQSKCAEYFGCHKGEGTSTSKAGLGLVLSCQRT